MLEKKKMDKYSDVLLWALKTARKGNYRKNDIVVVRYDPAAVRMAEILQGKILDMGMNPVMRMGLTSVMERNFFKKANNKQLIFQTPGDKELCNNLNGSIYLFSPDSLTHLSDVDPKKIGKAALVRKTLRDIMNRRDEKGLFGWTLCMLPTPELAKKAGLSTKQYAAQVIKACYLDKKEPVREWKKIYKNAIAIKKWINGIDAKYYHIESEKIDLKITPGKKRKWIC